MAKGQNHPSSIYNLSFTARNHTKKKKKDNLIFVAAIFCSFTASIYLWKILNWIWLRPRKIEKLLRQQGFQGNSYKLLFGDFREIRKVAKEALSKPMDFSNDIAHRADPIFHHARKNYGDNSLTWFGPMPTISIMDPEIIKEIMSKNYVFQKPSANSMAKMLVRGVFTYEKDKWAKHRKLINPAFHLEKLKHMVPSFYLSCSEMLRKWDDEIIAAKNDCSCELDVWPYLSAMTSDAISRTAFGSCYEEGRKIFELQREQVKSVVGANQAVYIPGWRFLPTKLNRKIKETAKEIEETLMGIINKRMKSMEASKKLSMNDDLLRILLDSNLNEIKQHGNVSGMTMKEVIEECELFYFAGQETTASLLVWTMILLSKHEDWQARAREEVLQVLGREKPEYEDLNHLKIVSMILYETLRLYPPGAVLYRATHTKARFGKLHIPAGVQLQLQVLQLHHDPQIWGDDAGIFNPDERFGEGVSKATGGRMAYFPFGWGPRVCIGQSFAMLEAKMAMAMILQHYSFKLSPSYSHAPYTIIILKPQHGAHLILTKL